MEINGKEIAQKIINNLKSQPKPDKILAAVVVDGNPVSINFLEQKKKIAEELGIDFRIYKFPENSSNDDLRKEIEKIALLKRVGGVIIQLPLLKHLNRQYILNVIPREKDVDVLGERALGAFYAGRNKVLPPAVGVVEEILENCKLSARGGSALGGKIENLRVAVVGLGFLIGKPVANWLEGKCSELLLLDIGSDLSILKQADLVILGVGKAGLINPGMFKKDALVIDFGYSVDKTGKIKGDLDINEGIKNLSYTPTPGGTGPILVAKIFGNFYSLNNE